jgi:hypothetical protein
MTIHQYWFNVIEHIPLERSALSKVCKLMPQRFISNISIAIAHALETKVYCDKRKAAILRCQSDPELHALLTDKPAEAGVHLVPLNVVSNENLKDYLARWNGHFTHIIGFRPTGWTYANCLPQLVKRFFAYFSY